MNSINIKVPIIVFSYFYCLFMSLINVYLAVVVLFFFIAFVLSKGVLSNTEKILIFVFLVLNYAFNSYNFNPITGVDEQAFIGNVRDEKIIELLFIEIKSFFESFGFISSRITFSAFLSVMLLGKEFVSDQYVIFILNSFFWFLSSHIYLTSLKNTGFLENIKVGYLFLFLSPTILYWTGNFGKDVVVVSLCMISASFFFKRKYILFVFFAVMALLFRPYSIIMIACFVVPLYHSLKVMVYFLLLTLAVFFYGTSFSLISLINTLIAFIYIFLSPNPTALTNWTLFSGSSDFLFSPLIMVLETIVISLVIVYAIFLKKYDKVLAAKLLLAIYCLSISLVGVGYTNMSGNDIALAIGSLGDNFVRKKIIVWPILAVLLNLLYCDKYINESSSRN